MTSLLSRDIYNVIISYKFTNYKPFFVKYETQSEILYIKKASAQMHARDTHYCKKNTEYIKKAAPANSSIYSRTIT